MKKYWKIIGIAAVAAGALYYPALKLFQYLAKKWAEGNGKDLGEEHHHIKTFSPAYRGVHPHHHPHHRKSPPEPE